MAEKYTLDMMTNVGLTVKEIAQEKPVLLVFLRHFGCIFCREALRDISAKRKEFESKGIEIVLVHMADNEIAEAYFNEYKLKGIKHVSDPECVQYAAFGLVKGSFSQLFGFKNFIRGTQQAFKGNFRVDKFEFCLGDVYLTLLR